MWSHDLCDEKDHERLLNTWWLSFSTPGKALGCIIVDAEDERGAMREVALQVLEGKLPDADPRLISGIRVMILQMTDCAEGRKEIAHFGKSVWVTPRQLDESGMPVHLIDEDSGDEIEVN